MSLLNSTVFIFCPADCAPEEELDELDDPPEDELDELGCPLEDEDGSLLVCANATPLISAMAAHKAVDLSMLFFICCFRFLFSFSAAMV
ncbi:MAG: hypothetical protein JWQ71_4928 [Pedosphaera sp.]|nr:hypothetical protein [Pedosphaera sp.]